MSLHIQPISFSEAADFIKEYHKTHDPPQGWKFGTAVNWDCSIVVGVATVGRPTARNLDDGYTVEVTRTCVRQDIDKRKRKNANSKLYAACWRAAKSLGYQRIVTYTLKDREDGTGLKAAGYNVLHETEGGSWDRDNRPRTDKHPTVTKERWEKWANGKAVK